MNLTTGFDKFLEKVNLDKTRIDRLKSAHNELRDALKAVEEIKKIYVNDYLQGSYILRMGIKPIKDGEYDVDIILELNLKDEKGNYIMDGYAVLSWLYNILYKIPAYKDKVEYPPKKRSVRIKYAKDLRLDISPVHYRDDNDPVLIVPDWKETNPKGFRKWCIEVQDKSDKQFYFVTRLLKYWRDIQFGVGSHPKSILLTTLIGQHVSTKEGITLNEALVKSMEKLNSCLQAMSEVPKVCNPSLASENLAEHWSYWDFVTFKQKFAKATETFKKAFDETDETKTIELLNSDELFKGAFPVTLYEDMKKSAMNMSEAIKDNKVGVTTGGALTTNIALQKVKVPSGIGSHGDF